MNEASKSQTKPSFERPVVQAFLLADQILEDRFTQKLSLIGLFDRFICRHGSFPYQHGSCSLFLSLINGRGQMALTFKMVALDTLAEWQIGQNVCLFNDPLKPLPIFLVFQPCFPNPGWYAFEALIGGEVLASKRVQVTHEPAPPEPLGGIAQ